MAHSCWTRQLCLSLLYFTLSPAETPCHVFRLVVVSTQIGRHTSWFHQSTPSKCCPKRWAPGCVTMRSKILVFFCIQNVTLSPNFTQSGAHHLEHPFPRVFLNLSHVCVVCVDLRSPKTCIRFQPLSSSQSSGRLTSSSPPFLARASRHCVGV